MHGTPWRRAHRVSERCGSVVRPQEGYNPENLSHLSKEYVPSKGIRSLFLERTVNSTIIIGAAFNANTPSKFGWKNRL